MNAGCLTKAFDGTCTTYKSYKTYMPYKSHEG